MFKEREELEGSWEKRAGQRLHAWKGEVRGKLEVINLDISNLV